MGLRAILPPPPEVPGLPQSLATEWLKPRPATILWSLSTLARTHDTLLVRHL